MNPQWNEWLIARGARFDGDQLSFSEQPLPEGGNGLIPLTHLQMIRSTGPDSAPFLHNLFSNDVNKQAEGVAQWNSFNSPKGRMLASFLVWRHAEGHELMMAADVHAAMLKKLSMYVLRSKVKLTDPGDQAVLLGAVGSEAEKALAQSKLPLPGADMQVVHDGQTSVIRLHARMFVVRIALDQAAALFDTLEQCGLQTAGTDAWQLEMIRAGVPLITHATQEEFVAQMLNYELIGGVSFNKGCYPGQEIVARTQYLGKLKKRMYRVELEHTDRPADGADLYAPEFGEQSAGKLVNVAAAGSGRYEALAVMQTSCAAGGEVHVLRPDGPQLKFLELPYALS